VRLPYARASPRGLGSQIVAFDKIFCEKKPKTKKVNIIRYARFYCGGTRSIATSRHAPREVFSSNVSSRPPRTCTTITQYTRRRRETDDSRRAIFRTGPNETNASREHRRRVKRSRGVDGNKSPAKSRGARYGQKFGRRAFYKYFTRRVFCILSLSLTTRALYLQSRLSKTRRLSRVHLYTIRARPVEAESKPTRARVIHVV